MKRLILVACALSLVGCQRASNIAIIREAKLCSEAVLGWVQNANLDVICTKPKEGK